MFVPKTDLSQGGTPFGNSYVTLFGCCPRKWFNEYYRPITIDGKLWRGIQPKYGRRPLLFGELFHTGLGVWYWSGVKDGEDTGKRDLDHAISSAEQQHQANAKYYQYPEEAEDDLDKVKSLLVAYHDHRGPGGEMPEWPQVRVQCDEQGVPLIEKLWTYPLGYENYVYTCRTDLIIENCGYLQTMEHKTSSVYGVRLRKRNVPTDPQFSGEYWVLNQTFPESPINGVLVNIIVKDRGLKSKYQPVERVETTRSEPELERWRLSTIDILKQIDQRVGQFEADIDSGVDVEVAADRHFPIQGMRNEYCYAYNSECEFLNLCRLAGLEQRQMGNYKGRILYDG